ncbi:MAG: hypothetical protein LH461_03205, partial [Spirochaetaceae bacterium]|nr:hypothetical protein [Spirochaetaceae bacterium]
MSRVAAYAARLAALPRALAILELHPAGLPLADLADELAVRPDDLREVFMAYYLADLVELGNFGQPVVEFFAPGATEEDVDPATAQWVRVVASDPEQELGVDHLSAEQLGRLFEAGTDLLALEPDNETLRSALDAFQGALWPAEGPSGAGWKAPVAQALHEAAQEQRRVRITYVRQWHPGSGQRVIEPYRRGRTPRGGAGAARPAAPRAPGRPDLGAGRHDIQVR